MKRPVLVADVGGTNTRFALAHADGSLASIRAIANDEVDGLAPLLAAALDHFESERPAACVLAVAGPVDDDEVTLTNRPWSFSQRTLRKTLKLRRLVVLNDFAAVAYALPALKPADLVSFGGGRSEPRGTMLACGPGTGFGAAALLRHTRRPYAIASEAGHMRLGAATADEARMIAHLVRELGAVAIEHVISGPGLSRLYRVLAGKEASSEAIVAAARGGEQAARETVNAFLRLFGRVAGDLALAFDARGGIFLAGGVGRALAAFFAASPFRAAFEEHPPYEGRLAAIPTAVIVHSAPGLVGAAMLARSLKLA